MSNPRTLPPVKPRPGRPLYLVARDTIRDAIDAGEFEPGQRMPSTAAVSRQLRVSLVTAHRALHELVGDGLLHRSQGRGTFVRPAGGAGAARRASGRVGLVFDPDSSLADHYHSQVLEGVRRGAQQLHVDLILLRLGEDVRGECDGFLYLNPLPSQLADVSKRAPKPCVVIGAHGTARGVAAVDTDNADLVEQAIDHLARLGHRRIGYIGGVEGPLATSNARDRWQGFVGACRRRNLTVDPGHVLPARTWRLDREERLRLTAMLGGPNPPTALFAAGYYYALDAYAAAEEAGLQVPEELSVVGVDDPPSAEHLSPSLTTLRQPLVQLGHAAVALLAERVSPSDREPEDDGGRTLRARLIPRRSTGPAPA